MSSVQSNKLPHMNMKNRKLWSVPLPAPPSAECVSEFVYLGTLFAHNSDCSLKIEQRVNLAGQSVGLMEKQGSEFKDKY